MKSMGELKVSGVKEINLRIICFSICQLLIGLCYLNAQSLEPLIANAGSNANVCKNDAISIGGNPSATGGVPPYTYSWQPTTGLDSSNSSNPSASPSSTTSYTLTVTDSIDNASTAVVNIAVSPLPVVDAGPDQTILAGTNVLLQGSGAVNYFWTPTDALTNQNTATPTAEPDSTTTYCVIGAGANGCFNYDCAEISIIPSDTIVTYNAFTPNGDGINDVFYMGNIRGLSENKIEIFNRNGKMVFQKSPYLNDWNGKIDGAELPCATYYYVFYPGNGKAKVQGAVTIVR